MDTQLLTVRSIVVLDFEPSCSAREVSLDADFDRLGLQRRAGKQVLEADTDPIGPPDTIFTNRRISVSWE